MVLQTDYFKCSKCQTYHDLNDNDSDKIFTEGCKSCQAKEGEIKMDVPQGKIKITTKRCWQCSKMHLKEILTIPVQNPGGSEEKSMDLFFKNWKWKECENSQNNQNQTNKWYEEPLVITIGVAILIGLVIGLAYWWKKSQKNRE